MVLPEIDELLALLGEEEALLGRLGETVGAKLKALVAVEPRGVHSAARREETLLGELVRLEGRRVALFHALAGGLSIEGEITIERLARALGEPQATRLRELKSRMGSRAREVRKMTEQSRELAAQCLGHVQGILGLIARGGEEPTYGAPGVPRAVARTASLVVDRRV